MNFSAIEIGTTFFACGIVRLGYFVSEKYGYEGYCNRLLENRLIAKKPSAEQLELVNELCAKMEIQKPTILLSNGKAWSSGIANNSLYSVIGIQESTHKSVILKQLAKIKLDYYHKKRKIKSNNYNLLCATLPIVSLGCKTLTGTVAACIGIGILSGVYKEYNHRKLNRQVLEECTRYAEEI